MFESLQQHSDVVQILLNALMLVVWFLYLHLIFMNFIRQRQSVILVTRGAARGPSARCFVTNMATEPVYLLAAFVYLNSESGSYFAPVTERDEVYLEDLNTPSEATNQGPLQSGESRDIGDFRTMERRARTKATHDTPPEETRDFTVVIVAASGHAARLVGAYQSFSVTPSNGDGPAYEPRYIVARQVRNLRRSRWRNLLDELR
jgi:hypothetical protein